MKKNFRVYEYLHIPFWLLKDSAWALGIKPMGVLMIFPTLTLAILIAIKTRKTIHELLPNISILLWIIANSIWMCDEFFELGIKSYCYFPFILGVIIILWWLVFYFPKIWKQG